MSICKTTEKKNRKDIRYRQIQSETDRPTMIFGNSIKYTLHNKSHKATGNQSNPYIFFMESNHTAAAINVEAAST